MTECAGLVSCPSCDQKVVCKDLASGNHDCKSDEKISTCEACGEMVIANMMKNHKESACHPVPCQHCNKKVSQNQLDAHEAACPERAVACPGPWSGDDAVAIADQEDSSRWEAKCKNGCGQSVKQRALLQHLQTECPTLWIRCLRCEQLVPTDVPDLKASPYVRVRHHEHTSCEDPLEACERGCGLQLRPNQMNSHIRNDGPNRSKKCWWPFCNREDIQDYAVLMEHVSSCGECGKEFTDAAELMQHLRCECGDFKISCPMTCGSRVAFKDLAQHFKDAQLSLQDGAPVPDGAWNSYWFPCPSGPDCSDLSSDRALRCKSDPCTSACESAGEHLPAAGIAGNAFIKHLKLCLRLPCPFSQGRCPTGILYGKSSEHLKKCEELQVPCFFGCGDGFHQSARCRDHASDFRMREVLHWMHPQVWRLPHAFQGLGDSPGIAL